MCAREHQYAAKNKSIIIRHAIHTQAHDTCTSGMQRMQKKQAAHNTKSQGELITKHINKQL